MTKLTSQEKAALVVLCLSEDVAIEVLRHLEPDELKIISDVVDSLDPVPYDALQPTMSEFERLMREPMVTGRGKAYMRKLTVDAVGRDAAARLLDGETSERAPMEIIGDTQAGTLARLLADEHPQVAAVILSQLKEGQAALVLRQLAETEQVDLLERIASMKEVPMETVEVASAALLKTLEGSQQIGVANATSTFDGLTFVASLLNALPSTDGDDLLESMPDEDLVLRIRNAMFTFEDIEQLDQRALQTLMREISSEDLVIALKTASEGLREKFFGAVSSRAADMMREDLELMGPTRLADVEAAQREIVETASRLAAAGTIVIGAGGGELV